MSSRETHPEAVAANFERAKQRGTAKGLAYAGEITPGEAWQLHDAGVALIVDVRTLPEWEFVGRVPASALVEWRRYGATQTNATFLDELMRVANPQEPVLFICRSGVRSHHAADLASRSGFAHAFNVLEGFEGDLDGAAHRGSAGWRAAGLPWVQS